ncbi:MAG: NBR1-Ig-like domain-containing protein, partial [Blastocatellia bacterium]
MERVLKNKWFNSLILLICLLATAQSSLASTFVLPADDDLVISARAIVTGKVLSIESSFDDQQERIYTYITIKVREVLKGQISDRKIVIKEMGGQVADRGFTLYGNPEFTLGEKVLLYLDTWNDGSLRTHQLFLGKFSIVSDEATGHQFVERRVPNDNVTVLRPQSLNGQPDIISTDRMELSTYMEMVRNRLEINSERSRQFQDTYYHGVPMLRQPAEYAKLKSHGDVEAQWTYISSQHPRWFEPDTGLPVTFMVNPAGAPNAEVMNDITAAMNAWSNTPGTALRIVNGGATGACRETFGLNLILFNSCDGRWSQTSGCSGTLALGGLGWTGNSKIIGGVTYLQATAGFVSFNPFASCSFGNHCNVQEVATHELGHAMGLGHSADSTATMYAFAHFDGRCASLKADDVAGITTMYPGTGGGGPGPLSVVTSSLAGGTVGSAYSQTLSATGGTPPYTWSLLSGGLPPGLILTPTGTIAGLPTTSGTFNFSVQVADFASGTAQKALSITVTPAGTQYDAMFLSQTVPATLTPGQTFNSTISWLNTGTQTWQGATGLRLISQNPFNNVTWGGNTVLLTNFTVPPGGQLDITFQAVAPATAGTYNFQWQVARDASTPFGQMSTNVSIQVGGGGGGGGTNGAAFVTQNVPSSMTAGQSASVSVTMQNTGTTTWAPGTYFLGSRNPTGNSTWGLSQAALASSVAPGGQATFTFNIAAPSVAGTYNFQWGMSQNGVGAFGASSTNVSINVTSGGGGSPNSAQFMSQIIPATWSPGQTYSVTINMKNTGTTNWSPLTYKLGSQSPANNTNWGTSRATVTKSISPGSVASFKFNVTAPTAPGTYNFQWQMIQDTTGFFGDMTLNMPMTVGGGGGGGTNGAAFVTQNVPSSMTA